MMKRNPRSQQIKVIPMRPTGRENFSSGSLHNSFTPPSSRGSSLSTKEESRALLNRNISNYQAVPKKQNLGY